MNRSGAAPQSLRGIPSGFGGQQSPQQTGRSVSSRLPNGKMGNNGSSWAFGGSVPMGNAGMQQQQQQQQQHQSRQLGGNVSFAQSLSGSQPATPLDLREFPTLSNNTLPSGGQASMWSNNAPRNMPSAPRNQTPLSATQSGPEDLFNSAPSRIGAGQGAFRYANQGSLGHSTQSPSGSADDFPPLDRNAAEDLGQERSPNLISSLGFGPQNGAPVQSQGGNRGNGLLNALSANSRANETRTPPGIGATGQAHDESSLQKTGSRDDRLREASTGVDGVSSNEQGLTRDDEENQEPQGVDPLAGMPAVDKWGIKGLRTLMNSFPDYHAMIVGIDPNELGIDLGSPEMISTQIYSLFDDAQPRPTVANGKFKLPDCYSVTNVQPIESKIQSFNEETLFWIFYSCPGDIKQQMAATELYRRNWRWHKKLQIWLTKDEQLAPQILSPSHERGFYIVWDTTNWRKDRREFTLHYGDLDTSLSQPPGGP